MHILIVQIHVKPDSIEAFRNACLENAKASVKEPGVARFDVIQQTDDPARFILFEVYKNKEGHAAHRETAHYAKWKETVTDMMAEARIGTTYTNVFPDDRGW